MRHGNQYQMSHLFSPKCSTVLRLLIGLGLLFLVLVVVGLLIVLEEDAVDMGSRILHLPLPVV